MTELPALTAPHAYPLVGHAPQFLSDKLAFLRRCGAQRDVYRIRIGRCPTYLLSNPDDIRHVLVGEHRLFAKTPRLTGPRGRSLFGEGILTSVGEQHLRQRRMLQPAFHQRLIDTFGGVVSACAGDLVERWTHEREVDVATETRTLALQVMLRTLIGPGDAGRAGPALGAAIEARRRYIEHVFLSVLPFPHRTSVRTTRDFRDASDLLDGLLRRLIAERRRVAEPRGDLLSLLLAARYEDGTGMNDEQALGEALTFAITGFETLGEALAWTSYLLAAHPAVQRLASEEVDATLGDNPPIAADVQRLPYLQQVFSEALRLYPPSWILVRIARGDVILPSGSALERGARLYLSPWVTQRDPRFFPDPERFDPERFRPGREPSTRPKHAYFPFGGGPRVCIGEGFARMEAALVFARILQRFSLRVAPGIAVTPEPGITLRPREAIPLQLDPR